MAMDCEFCQIAGSDIVHQNELCFAVRDRYAVTERHILIITKRHVADFFELYPSEVNAIHVLMAKCEQEILEQDVRVTGFNVGINAGVDAGQTIMHCHVHLIPRRKGDTQNPTGGVRGVIPARQAPAKRGRSKMWRVVAIAGFAGAGVLVYEGLTSGRWWMIGLGLLVGLTGEIILQEQERPFTREWTRQAKGQQRIHGKDRVSLWWNGRDGNQKDSS